MEEERSYMNTTEFELYWEYQGRTHVATLRSRDLVDAIASIGPHRRILAILPLEDEGPGMFSYTDSVTQISFHFSPRVEEGDVLVIWPNGEVVEDLGFLAWILAPVSGEEMREARVALEEYESTPPSERRKLPWQTS